jgi:hypothetical protein
MHPTRTTRSPGVSRSRASLRSDNPRVSVPCSMGPPGTPWSCHARRPLPFAVASRGTDRGMAGLEPHRGSVGPAPVAGRIGRRPLATASSERSAMRRTPSPAGQHRRTRGTGYPVPVRHLREPVARSLRTTAAGMAADAGRGHRLALGHGHRTRAGMAGPIRLPVEAQTRLRHVCVVRARHRRAAGRPRLRDTPVHALREPSRRHPGARRTKDTTHGAGPTGAASPTGRDVRRRSSAGRGRPLAVRAVVDGGPTLLPLDQRRAGSRRRGPRA